MPTRLLSALLLPLAALSLVAQPEVEPAPRQVPLRYVEKLDRGVIAVHQGGGKVFVSWRLFGTDPEYIGQVDRHLNELLGSDA